MLITRDLILKLREEGLTQRQIGGKLGISSERVRQILVIKSSKRDIPQEDIPMSTGDVAHMLNIHTNTVRRWSRTGILRTFRIGPRGDRRFMRTDVLKLIKKAD